MRASGLTYPFVGVPSPLGFLREGSWIVGEEELASLVPPPCELLVRFAAGEAALANTLSFFLLLLQKDMVGKGVF